MLFIFCWGVNSRQAAILKLSGKLVGIDGVTLAVLFFMSGRDIGRVYYDAIDAEFFESSLYPEPGESHFIDEMVDPFRVILFQVFFQSLGRRVH